MRLKNLNDTIARTYQGVSISAPRHDAPLVPVVEQLSGGRTATQPLKQQGLTFCRRATRRLRQPIGQAVNLGDPEHKRIDQ